MKELTIEEKAKRYDIALEKIKMLLGTGSSCSREELEYVFPELKEDERIRKELIDFVKSRLAGFPQCEKFIAWIKKQGEQKPVDKVESKFKVGDFIVNDYCMGRIVEITNDAYLLDTEQGIPFSCEHNTHLWTIQDAKDGDVLATHSGIVFIFKNIMEGGTIGFHVAMPTANFASNSKIHIPDDNEQLGDQELFPASKEQRYLLFQKMKEAGYEWDAEKKELRKIEQKYTPKHKVGDTIYYNSFGESKSMIVANVFTDSTDNPMYEDKEGNAVFEKDIIEQKSADVRTTGYWLVEDTEQKPAWSEEDRQNVDSIIAALTYCNENGVSDCFVDPDILIDWLKSLKERYTWKPCDYELEVLRLAAEKDGTCLMGLYEQLKKLREE